MAINIQFKYKKLNICDEEYFSSFESNYWYGHIQLHEVYKNTKYNKIHKNYTQPFSYLVQFDRHSKFPTILDKTKCFISENSQLIHISKNFKMHSPGQT